MKGNDIGYIISNTAFFVLASFLLWGYFQEKHMKIGIMGAMAEEVSLLRDIPERKVLRVWFNNALIEKSQQSPAGDNLTVAPEE